MDKCAWDHCNPHFISVYSDAKDVTSSGHILGKDIFARRMFTNVERTGSRKGSHRFSRFGENFGGTISFAVSIVSDNNFSNSLIIHHVKTKKITTVKEVWIPGLN